MRVFRSNSPVAKHETRWIILTVIAHKKKEITLTNFRRRPIDDVKPIAYSLFFSAVDARPSTARITNAARCDARA